MPDSHVVSVGFFVDGRSIVALCGAAACNDDDRVELSRNKPTSFSRMPLYCRQNLTGELKGLLLPLLYDAINAS